MRNTYTPGAYLLLTGSLTGSAPVASTVATVSGTGTAASAAGLVVMVTVDPASTGCQRQD